jgi:hypothetical protein
MTGKRLDHFPRCQIGFNPCHADSMRDMIERWAHMLSRSPYSMITAHEEQAYALVHLNATST